MTLLYRSSFSTRQEDLLEDARRAYANWLAASGQSADCSDDGSYLDEALLIRSCAETGRSCVMLRFDTGCGGERTRTTLVAGSTAGTGWVLAEVEAPELGPAARTQLRVVPSFVASLMGRGVMLGRWPASSAPLEHLSSVSDVQRCLRTASVPLVLYVQPGGVDATWECPAMAELICSALGMIVPLRLSITVVDNLAADLPEMRSLRSGSLYFVLPARSGAELHRTEVPRTVVQSQPRAVARDLQRRALAYAVASGLPVPLAAELLTLPGMPNGPAADDEQALELVAVVMEERDSARRDLAVLQNEHEDTIVEFDEALEQLDAFQRRLRFLEQRLAEAGDFVAGILEEEALPTDVNSCLEAVDLAREYLPSIAIDLDERTTKELEGQARTPIWAKVAWQAMQAMQDYANLKATGSFRGDFLEFCSDPPAGSLSFQAGRVALNESEATNRNPLCRRARTFAVPLSVSGTGTAYMPAHIKIAPVGSPAPRLHYLDDTGVGRTGKLYVGYFGPHLPTGGG